MTREPVEELRRWEDSGAHWQVLGRTANGLTIALLRCDGGEEAGRIVSDDPALLDFIGSRDRSED